MQNDALQLKKQITALKDEDEDVDTIKAKLQLLLKEEDNKTEKNILEMSQQEIENEVFGEKSFIPRSAAERLDELKNGIKAILGKWYNILLPKYKHIHIGPAYTQMNWFLESNFP